MAQSKIKEEKFGVEEFHRGKWQPLMKPDGEQKYVVIYPEQAERMNAHAKDLGERYVAFKDAEKQTEATENASEETEGEETKKGGRPKKK